MSVKIVPIKLLLFLRGDDLLNLFDKEMVDKKSVTVLGSTGTSSKEGGEIYITGKSWGMRDETKV